MKIKKGEVLLIKSYKSFDDRIKYINDNFPINFDVILLKNKTISIDDVRVFKNDFQKNTSSLNSDFKKLGILIFDDISLNASNALLKILEDIDKENCIILYTNSHIKLLSTILSRVIQVDENDYLVDNEILNNKYIQDPDLSSKDDLDKQEIIKWIESKIEKSKINKDKIPLVWINGSSPNIKYIVEYVNLFY